jgi:argininosuccinate lyase
MIRGARFDAVRMSAAASDDLIAATDIADHLVKQGLPFRACHGIVAGLVRVAVDSGRGLGELTDEELAAASDQLEPAAVRRLLAQSSWLESKVSAGGTALARVREQLDAARSALAQHAA